MKTTIRLHIRPPLFDKESPLATWERYNMIAEYCRTNQLSDNIPNDLRRSEYGFHARFDNNENDPRLEVIFEMLGAMGRQVFPRMVPKGGPPGSVSWTIVRYYTKKDLDKFDYFQLNCWGEKRGVFLPPALDANGAILGYKASDMGKTRWKLPFMVVAQAGHLTVNNRGKDLLESSGLKGLVFEEIEWIDPESAKSQCFLVQPSYTMPSCLNQMIEDDYEGRWVIDGPDNPPILRFDKKLVEALGDFDYAKTVEMLGVEKSTRGRQPQKIITRKFRDFLIQNKIYIEVGPVVLIE